MIYNIIHVLCSEYKAAFVICIDNSANIGSVNWQLIINFVQEIVKQSKVGFDQTHVGIVTFGMSYMN